MDIFKILLVESEGRLLATLTETLHQVGYTIRTAESGILGLQEMKSFKPDLLILSMNLPDMSGMSFILKAGKSVPIIALAGAEESFYLSGARAIIFRPISIDKLLIKVQHIEDQAN